MQIQTKPITLITFAKLAICGIFLNYYCYNILRGGLLPYGTAVFYAIAIVCVLGDLLQGKISISSEIKCWIVYIVFSLVTVGFAIDSNAAFKSIWEYVQRLILIMMISYICEKEKSVNYSIRLLAVTAIACAVSSLMMNESVSKKLTMTSGAIISTNDIGAIMAFGCFAVLFAFGLKEHKGLIKTLIKISYIIAALSVIFLAGSRKSILAIIILFVLLFLFCAKDYFNNISTTQLIIVTLLLIATAIFVYNYLLPNVEQTDMYARIYGRKAEGALESDADRIALYRQAMEAFFNNPLFGLGYNNFEVLHYGTYTHSTYVEPLACSGIGGFLYLAPYVMILAKQINLIKLFKHDTEERLWQKELLAFYISFLFVGIGIPYIYKDIPCIILAMFIASQKISFDKLKEAELIEASEEVNSESITVKSFAN